MIFRLLNPLEADRINLNNCCIIVVPQIWSSHLKRSGFLWLLPEILNCNPPVEGRKDFYYFYWLAQSHGWLVIIWRF